jgi:tRNA uridine 5-carboxymethylaminomethyl modification enzyme
MKFDKVQSYVAENDLDQEILEQAEIQVKYGYIEKKEIMPMLTSFRRCKDSADFDYDKNR